MKNPDYNYVPRGFKKIEGWWYPKEGLRMVGDYSDCPDVVATWFVDPPYNNQAGSHYVWGPKKLDYPALGEWCKNRQGRVIVCENEGATWLPFATFETLKAGLNGKGSKEVIYSQDSLLQPD